MGTYQKLYIDPKGVEPHIIIECIERSLCNGWSRDFQKERKYKLDRYLNHYCFKLNTNNKEFLLWIEEQEDDLAVFNITPSDYETLSDYEFNYIQDHFIDSVLREIRPDGSVFNKFSWYTTEFKPVKPPSFSIDTF